MVYIKLPVAKTSEKPSCIDFVVGFFSFSLENLFS